MRETAREEREGYWDLSEQTGAKTDGATTRKPGPAATVGSRERYFESDWRYHR